MFLGSTTAMMPPAGNLRNYPDLSHCKALQKLNLAVVATTKNAPNPQIRKSEFKEFK